MKPRNLSLESLPDDPSLVGLSKPAVRKLIDIVSYQESAEQLKRYPLYMVHTIYSYTGELAAACVGVGIASPLGQVILGAEGTDIVGALKDMPTGLYITTALAAAVWIVLKVIVHQNDAIKRASLARSCRREMAKLNIELNSALDEGNPMPGLNAVFKAIQDIIQRHHAEGSWPLEWQAGPAPDHKIANKVSMRVKALCKKFGSTWNPPPQFNRFEKAE